MKQNIYEIEKNVEKIKKGLSTGFLTKNISLDVKRRLKKDEYLEFFPYFDAEKTILYSKDIPCVRLYKIQCTQELTHSSILGSLFGLNITSEVFGDIVFFHDSFYVYLLDSISDLVVRELTIIGKNPVKFIEVDIALLENFKRDYKEIDLIVSSLRFDTICSRLIGCNREEVQRLIRDKEVLINYELARRPEYLLKKNDVFSIRRYGKYRFMNIIGRTKKENYIILIQKYI